MAAGTGRGLGGGPAVTAEPPHGDEGRECWARPRCPRPPCPARPAVTRRPRGEERPPSAPAIAQLGPGRRRLPAHGTAAPALSPASSPGRGAPPRGAGTARQPPQGAGTARQAPQGAGTARQAPQGAGTARPPPRQRRCHRRPSRGSREDGAERRGAAGGSGAGAHVPAVAAGRRSRDERGGRGRPAALEARPGAGGRGAAAGAGAGAAADPQRAGLAGHRHHHGRPQQVDLRGARVPLPAAALGAAHAVRRGRGLPAGLGAGTRPPAPSQDLPAQPHLLHQRGPGQPGPELRAAGRGASRGHHHAAGDPGAGGAGGPAAAPAAVLGHGAGVCRSRLQHRRRALLLPARLRLPPCRHRAPRPQVHPAECAAAGGSSGRAVPARPDVPAQLRAAVRSGRGAGAGPLVAGRPSPRRRALGLRPAQLPGLRPLQPGHLLPPVPHLGPHAAPPGKSHRGGQPAAVAAAVRHAAGRAGLRRRGADAGRDGAVPPAPAPGRLLGAAAASAPRVGTHGGIGARRALGECCARV